MESSEGVRVPLRQLSLDQLLDDVQARLDTARDTQDRMHSLLEAVLTVGRELDHTFLGVPARVLRTLELAKQRAGDLDDEDEAVLSVVAVAAGVAIDHARLYEESAHRERWLRANAEITFGLLSGGSRTEVLGMIAERAREISSAALAVVAVPVADGDSLSVELAIGSQAQAHRGLALPVEGTFMGAAFSAGAPVTSADVCHDARVTVGPPRFSGLGPAVAAPIGSGDGVRGVVLLARESGGAVFTAGEAELLAGFAGQAAVAMELAERRRDAEQIRLLEERDRIARDLHDLAIQRLFATGMTLQSAGRFITHPEASERVLRAVDDLDETIKIIRSTIFGLRSHGDAADTHLRARVVREASEAGEALGFAPGLRMEGMLDTRVPKEIADHTVAVLSEALSNVARHARAGRVDVILGTDGREVRLTVRDDGVGMTPGGLRTGHLTDPSRTGGGLCNLAERARYLGGALELGSSPAGGTSLTWHVPVPAGDGAARR